MIEAALVLDAKIKKYIILSLYKKYWKSFIPCRDTNVRYNDLFPNIFSSEYLFPFLSAISQLNVYIHWGAISKTPFVKRGHIFVVVEIRILYPAGSFSVIWKQK